MRNYVLAAVLTIAMIPVFGRAQGCAMCKTALEQSEEGQQLAKSFDYGILFLMGIPYAMFGTAGFVMFRAYRKAVKAKESTNTDRR